MLYRLARPALQRLPAELAHGLTVQALKHDLVGRRAAVQDAVLRVTFRGLEFPNPLGLAAGFDKNAEVADAMLGQGFGFVEVGTVTPRPQTGNAKPRLFRLPEDAAVINRLGFNNRGLAAAATNLRRRKRRGIVGVNIGANRDADDRIADYVAGLNALGAYADYLVINVSSPNTPGLRELQGRAALEALFDRLYEARDGAGLAVPIALKIAPDLSPAEIAEIAEFSLARGLDGLIVGNTTVGRPAGLTSRHRTETGGLSGRPLFQLSTEVLRQFYRRTAGRIPLVGVGGVASAADAYAKIRAGASLVQLYTALIYHGPGLVARINRELAELLRADGFEHVRAAVGADVPLD